MQIQHYEMEVGEEGLGWDSEGSLSKAIVERYGALYGFLCTSFHLVIALC